MTVFNFLNSKQINDSRDGEAPEDDVVDEGDEVDGDEAVGEEEARRLLQFALEDLQQGARLNHVDVHCPEPDWLEAGDQTKLINDLDPGARLTPFTSSRCFATGHCQHVRSCLQVAPHHN